jgi:hypothetical protein
MDEDIEKLGQEVSDSINNWFENYDWDEAFEKMLRKYE